MSLLFLRMLQRLNNVYETSLYKEPRKRLFLNQKHNSAVSGVWTVHSKWAMKPLSKQRGENKILTICSLREQIFCAVNVRGVL